MFFSVSGIGFSVGGIGFSVGGVGFSVGGIGKPIGGVDGRDGGRTDRCITEAQGREQCHLKASESSETFLLYTRFNPSAKSFNPSATLPFSLIFRENRAEGFKNQILQQGSAAARHKAS